jgi:arylsulfatase
LPADHKKLFARLQETYAGFLEHTDHEIGRLVDHLDAIGQLDNTLIVLLSDNGASAEGGPTGAINLRKHMVYEKEDPSVGLARLDQIGSEMAYNHYPTGWAQVSNTPLKWYKKGAHGGGVRAPLIMNWAGQVAAPGALRHQYHHVTDIAPTLYDILDIKAPAEFRGIPQLPIHGTSMAYTLAQSAAPTTKHTQLFELLGDRAIWHRGWKAVARHPKGNDFESDAWELYHLEQDYAEIVDLSAKEPAKLRELVDLWWQQAREMDVLPLDDRDWERAAERLKEGPTRHYEFHGDMSRIDRLASPDITDRSYTVQAEFEVVPGVKPEGVLLAWGSHFGGFVLFMKNGKVCYEYVYSESLKHELALDFTPVPGKNIVTLRFERSGKNAGEVWLAAGSSQAGPLAIPRTWPTHGTTAGLNCGLDAGAPVSFSYERPFCFTGSSLRVSVDLELESDAPTGAAYATVLKEQ